jgi:hypothetical protein
MYAKGTCISSTTTPVVVQPKLPYARAFAPAGGGSWPGGPGKRAVLLVNLESRKAQTVAMEGLRGAELWYVVHGVSGAWDVPFAKAVSAADTLEMAPLGVYLAFVS